MDKEMKKKISDKMYWALAFAGIEPIKTASKSNGKKKKAP
jgi:hypothetical protein